MVKENKSLMIGLLIIAGILLFLVGNYVGNTVKVLSLRRGIEVYTKAEIDSLLKNIQISASGIPSYMDPKQCEFKIFTNTPENSGTRISCLDNQFVGMVTHIDCPNLGDVRTIVGTGWYDNTLPNELAYTCINSVGEMRTPTQIFAYCCNIAGTESIISTKEEVTNNVSKQHKTTVDPTTKKAKSS